MDFKLDLREYKPVNMYNQSSTYQNSFAYQTNPMQNLFNIQTLQIPSSFNIGSIGELSAFNYNINTPGTGLIDDIKNSNIFSNRDKQKIAQLPELTQEKLFDLKMAAKEKGLDFTINSGYRSLQKQAAMKQAWDSGSRSGLVAKPAEAGYSYHNFGYALDINATKGTLEEIGKLAESMGWHWGGKNDKVHIDLRNSLGGETLASLRRKSGLS